MTELATPEVELSRRHIIKRPRLTHLLDETTARVILLVAPAGYGKTTLAREWLEATSRRVAWYRARRASSDVAALAVGLADSLSGFASVLPERVRSRLSVTRAPEEEIDALAELIEAELTAWPKDAWVVIDDYQLIAQSSSAESLVSSIVGTTPLNILVLSRERPKWATPRRVLYGEILEVGRNTLAMTKDEAAAALAAAPQDRRSDIVERAGG